MIHELSCVTITDTVTRPVYILWRYVCVRRDKIWKSTQKDVHLWIYVWKKFEPKNYVMSDDVYFTLKLDYTNSSRVWPNMTRRSK